MNKSFPSNFHISFGLWITCLLLCHCLTQSELRHAVGQMRPGLLARRAGTYQAPQILYILCQSYCWAVVKGPKTPCGTPVTKGTAAAVCLCWSIPHLPIVHKTKGYLSPEALLWYTSKCQFHNLAGKKNHLPLASLLFLYLFSPHRDPTKGPSRHKTSHKPFNAWQLTQGA